MVPSNYGDQIERLMFIPFYFNGTEKMLTDCLLVDSSTNIIRRVHLSFMSVESILSLLFCF